MFEEEQIHVIVYELFIIHDSLFIMNMITYDATITMDTLKGSSSEGYAINKCYG